MTASEERWSGVRLIVAALLLTVLASLVGSGDWPAPRRASSGRQVADVPAPLLTLLLATAGLGLAVAVVLARPHRLGAAVTATWWAVAAARTGDPGRVNPAPQEGRADSGGRPVR